MDKNIPSKNKEHKKEELEYVFYKNETIKEILTYYAKKQNIKELDLLNLISSFLDKKIKFNNSINNNLAPTKIIKADFQKQRLEVA